MALNLAEMNSSAGSDSSEFNVRSVGTLIACIAIALFSAAPILGATFGVFMVPMSNEFGWGRGQISGVSLAIPLTITLLTVPYGYAMDRWGVRRVVLIAILLYGSAVMALSLANGRALQVYTLFILAAVFGTPLGPLAISKTLTGWFHRRRALALGLASGIGGGLGLALMPQVARILFEAEGWRGAYVALGASVLVLAMPTIYLLLREAVSIKSQRQDDGQISSVAGMSGREALKTRTLWQLVAAIVLITLGIGGTLGHLIPMLTDRGISLTAATGVMSFMAISLLAGQVISGYLMDKFDTPAIAAPFFATCLFGVAVLQHGSTTATLTVGGILLGVGLGAETSMVPYFVSRYFGLRSFGQILGYVLPFSSLASASAPLFMGIMFDASGSYDTALYMLELGMALAIVLVMTLGRFNFAAVKPS